MIIDKEYALVDATARLNTDLRDYESEINRAASVTFGNDLIEVIVYQFSFVIKVRTNSEKIKHGLLINFGKNIAKQVSSLCASAMRVYPNEKHKPSRQLFHCIN
ncbi:hypothetical protein [Citrobacter portucalensis]|uniref:Uncharacterized protein n=1 Tax=Citrobacter portucalensis TaxID=1639133 RepID=A0AAW5W5L1_9ENTR|nr:hypothetical protein [Citrobacter portucalensis]MCX8984898.1 hypothetical protein [Citrobacter portucalensis]MCX9001452.1 hypothetical protein [Citrobacter portucalensis]